jgi:hypothetical protein
MSRTPPSSSIGKHFVTKPTKVSNNEAPAGTAMCKWAENFFNDDMGNFHQAALDAISAMLAIGPVNTARAAGTMRDAEGMFVT